MLPKYEEQATENQLIEIHNNPVTKGKLIWKKIEI